MGGGDGKKNHARQNVRKKNSCKEKPKEKIHAQDGPHFDSKPELLFSLKSVPKCAKWQ